MDAFKFILEPDEVLNNGSATTESTPLLFGKPTGVPKGLAVIGGAIPDALVLLFAAVPWFFKDPSGATAVPNDDGGRVSVGNDDAVPPRPPKGTESVARDPDSNTDLPEA